MDYFNEYEAQIAKARTPTWPERLQPNYRTLITGDTLIGTGCGQTVTYCNAIPTARTFTAADLNQ